MIAIENATLRQADGASRTATVRIQGDRIVDISDTRAQGTETRINAHGMTLTAGLVDLQVNGAFGHDFTANPETMWKVAEALPRYGVTAFLPTIVTSPRERVAAAMDELAKGPPRGWRGARPVGLHLEGPFLNPQKKGAHNPRWLCAPDRRTIQDWSGENGVRLVTLAPELPGALDLVRELVRRGVVVSAGHTMATLEQAERGYSAGIRYATHLFNAMPPLDHRAPGVAGAVLARDGWTTGLIPDGIHVHPAVVKTIWRAKGGQGLNLVSDAMAGLGMRPGRYILNDMAVDVTERDARLEDGTLAGSILPLDTAVRNLVQFTGCSFHAAIETVTTTPARLLGMAMEQGEVTAGSRADLALWDDGFRVAMTIVGGEIAYRASRGAADA